MSGRHSSTPATRRFAYTLPGLLAAQARNGVGGLIALAVIVLVLAGLASAAPIVLRSLTTAEVGYQVDQLPATQRDITTTTPGGPILTAGEGLEQFGTMTKSLAALHAKQPEPLRDVMGTAQWVSMADVKVAVKPDFSDSVPIAKVSVTVAPGIEKHVRITDGAVPAAFTDTIDPPVPTTYLDAVNEAVSWKHPVEFMLSKTMATRMKWTVGETRVVVTKVGLFSTAFPLKLSGTFAPIDEHDDYWSMMPLALEPSVSHTSFSGTYTEIDTGAAFVDPGSWGKLKAPMVLALSTAIRYPIDVAGVDAATAAKLLPQLRHFLADDYNLSSSSVQNDETISKINFDSIVGNSLSTALARGSTATAVIAMAAAGPIGVAIAVLWLLVRLIVRKRHDGLALARARGAAGWQLRLVLALEALVISAPAAALGMIVAVLLLPAEFSAASLVFPGIAAAAPCLLIALSASGASVRHTRADLNPRSRGRARWITEVIVLALTAVATALLLHRGLSSAGPSVDPLLAAVPLLLAISTALIVLRLYPLPLIAIEHQLRRRRGIVAYLGAARGVRDPSSGLAPVLALVVGVSVTVFSGVLLSTVDTGVHESAASEVGADVRLSGPDLSAKQLDQLAALDGVQTVVGISTGAAPVNATFTDGQKPTFLIIADTAALSRLQHGIPGAVTIPAKMDTKTAGGIPAVFSNPWAYANQNGGTPAVIQLGDTKAHPVGDPGTSTSLTTVRQWALIDTTMADQFGVNVIPPRLALITVKSGADASDIAAKAAAVAGPGADTLIQAQVVDRIAHAPVASGLQVMLVGMIAAVALFCALAVVLSMMIGAAARERLLSLLRIIGLSPRQSRGIVAWETGPSAIVAVVVGVGLGVALTLVVLAGVDLRTFTSGVAQPGASVNPLILAAIIGGFIVIVVAAAGVAMSALRRMNLARTIRTFEEG